MPGSYLVAGARTPIGKLSGALGVFSAAEPAVCHRRRARARRRGRGGRRLRDHGAGPHGRAGQVPARQAAVNAGIPMRVPSVNVNKARLSGLNAVYLADQMIAAGEADVVVAGGWSR